jgi:ParB family chromosome partitioning protein
MDIDDKVSKLEYEVEENLQRRDFTPEEAAKAAQELARLKNPGFFRKIWNAIVDFFRRLFRLD